MNGPVANGARLSWWYTLDSRTKVHSTTVTRQRERDGHSPQLAGHGIPLAKACDLRFYCEMERTFSLLSHGQRVPGDGNTQVTKLLIFRVSEVLLVALLPSATPKNEGLSLGLTASSFRNRPEEAIRRQ